MNIKRTASRGILLLLLLFSFSANVAWGRLPKPVKATGTVVAVDLDKQTLLIRQPKGKKPFLLDWNNQTEFTRDRQPASAAALKQGTPVVIFYKDVSFHNPLLKKVLWNETVEGK